MFYTKWVWLHFGRFFQKTDLVTLPVVDICRGAQSVFISSFFTQTILTADWRNNFSGVILRQ
jgi:hypothetical protein